MRILLRNDGGTQARVDGFIAKHDLPSAIETVDGDTMRMNVVTGSTELDAELLDIDGVRSADFNRPFPPLHCPQCGCYGNTEDAIELGGPCINDDCDGTIQSTRPVIQTDIDGRVMVTLPPLSMTTDQAIALVALLREVEADEPADDIEAVLGVGG